MERQMNFESSVPASIQLLFNNNKLDMMKLLCLINALSTESNKQRKVEELLFYYSLVNFELTYLFDEKKSCSTGFAPSANQYFRFQTKVNEILLAMSHLKFIQIKGELSYKLDDLKVKLLITGKEFFNEHSTCYFTMLFNKYLDVYNRIQYSSENVSIIKEGKN